MIYLARGAERDLLAISARLREPVPLDDLRRQVLGVSRGALAIATLIGVALVVLDLWIILGVDKLRPSGALHWCWVVGRDVFMNVLFFRIFGWALATGINLSKLAHERVAVRLLEPGDPSPSSRMEAASPSSGS